jgi:hypothetical protein
MAIVMWLGLPAFPVMIVGTLVVVLVNYLVSRQVEMLRFAILPMGCVVGRLWSAYPIPPDDLFAKKLAGFLSILVSDGAVLIMFVLVAVVSTFMAIYGPLRRLPSVRSLIKDSTGKPPTEKR